jgi:hypothetical protein
MSAVLQDTDRATFLSGSYVKVLTEGLDDLGKYFLLGEHKPE